MSPEEEAFLSTKQEKIKLNIALSAFFKTEDSEWKERCRAYLKKRFRPAMSELIRRGDILHIRALTDEGWLTKETLDSFIREAGEAGQPEVCALLLNLKKELFGFQRREFLMTHKNKAGQPEYPSGKSRDSVLDTAILQEDRDPAQDTAVRQEDRTFACDTAILQDDKDLARDKIQCQKERNTVHLQGNRNPARDIALCGEIWTLARNQLMIQYPLFRPLLMNFRFQESEETETAGTDGHTVYYCPDFLLKSFRQEPESTEALLLHMVYHCLFLHPLLDVPEDLSIWNLACDIAVYRITKLNSGQKTSAPLSSPELLYEKLLILTRQIEACRAIPATDPRGSFERISIVENGFRTFPELSIPQVKLCPDDHHLWKKADKNELLDQAGAVWVSAGTEAGFGLFGSDGIGTAPGNKTLELMLEQKRANEFRRYLKRFAIHREELTPDLASFDYIPYLFGLKHYGNIPLIEHLEYQEINRLEELVIAIDTSGSCSVETVRRFMEETYTILSDHENFFNKMNVYVIQCDCFVRDAAHITCEKDWQEYLKKITIHGRGGTDFRPVFKRVEELRHSRKLKNLKGLLYFTDGDGIYPEKPTDYETAFVFYKEKEHHQQVPPWAKILHMAETL